MQQKQKSVILQCMKILFSFKEEYARPPFQKIADVVVTLRNKMKCFANNLLLNIFGLQHMTQQSQSETRNVSFNFLYCIPTRWIQCPCDDDPHQSTNRSNSELIHTWSVYMRWYMIAEESVTIHYIIDHFDMITPHLEPTSWFILPLPASTSSGPTTTH